MHSTIKKEMLVATLLLILVVGIMIFNFCLESMFYDFTYMVVFNVFYIRYIKIKIKQIEDIS